MPTIREVWSSCPNELYNVSITEPAWRLTYGYFAWETVRWFGAAAAQEARNRSNTAVLVTFTDVDTVRNSINFPGRNTDIRFLGVEYVRHALQASFGEAFRLVIAEDQIDGDAAAVVDQIAGFSVSTLLVAARKEAEKVVKPGDGLYLHARHLIGSCDRLFYPLNEFLC